MFPIIKRLLDNEKTRVLTQDYNVYSFLVDVRANKLQIKKEVERTFGVKVSSCRTLLVRKESRRLGKDRGKRKIFKKALVSLVSGDKIEFQLGVV